MARNLVIGSGPAGVAAAAALLDRGESVEMIDIGEGLEPERAVVRDRMAALDPEEWNPEDLHFVREPPNSKTAQDLRVHPYGSSFPYRAEEMVFGPAGAPAWAGIRPTSARGGLSSAWGAAVAPYRQQDMADWPITSSLLGPHYAATQRLMPLSAQRDALERLLPLYGETEPRFIPMSAQAEALMNRLEAKSRELEAAGIHYGRARLAVDPGCVRCGMCLYGCPYGFIFNAADAIERFQRNRAFKYRSGLRALSFEEGELGVRLLAQDPSTGSTQVILGDRVFIGCGALPTALLVLSSLNAAQDSVVLRDSEYFLLPTVQLRAPKRDVATERLHTLAQIYVEIDDPSASRRSVHVQVYTYNDRYPVDMERRLGPFSRGLGPFITLLSRRLVVAQGFLHSDLSSTLSLRLVTSGDASRLEMSPKINPDADEAISAATRKLRFLCSRAGLLPITMFRRTFRFGHSYHCGGSFPMRRNPRGLESDALGRPGGLKRVFIVDSSVFPSIPSTTITFTIMANAHRIASEAPALGI